MAQQNQGKDGSDGDYVAYLMLGALVLLGVWAIWTTQREYIIYFSIMMREPLMWLLSNFSDNAAMTRQLVHSVPLSDINFPMYSSMMSVTGAYVKWFYILPLAYFAYKIYVSSFSAKFKRKHSMKTLVAQEKQIWPEISPVANLDLIDAKTYSGKWGFSKTEREFVNEKKMLRRIKTSDGSVIETLSYPVSGKVFAAQLGPLWRGVNNLRPYEKVLFAIYAARIAGEKDLSLELARDVSRTNENEPYRFDFKWVDECIKKYGGHELVKKAIEKHAYVATVLCTMLQLSRTDGVFSSALWIWLKPTDRNLFYALNCVGRYADFIEVCGITSHWKAEKRMGIRIFKPYVSASIEGTETALKDYCDDDYLERIFK